MSTQHKPALHAFMIVSLLCAAIVANGLHGQAVRDIVHRTAQHVGSAFELHREHRGPQRPGQRPAADPLGPRQ